MKLENAIKRLNKLNISVSENSNSYSFNVNGQKCGFINNNGNATAFHLNVNGSSVFCDNLTQLLAIA